MSETGAGALRRQARWVVSLATLALLPGMFALVVSVSGAPMGSPFVAWCAEWWWTLLVAGGIPYLLIQFGSNWFAFRCPGCRFRLLRGGVTPIDFLLKQPRIRYCPHCGIELAKAPGSR